MARVPDWFQRLPEILADLEKSKVAALGQHALERLFGCSRSEAFRLLTSFGAETVDDQPRTIRRELLVAQLEAIRAGDTYQDYLRRNREIGEKLAARRAARMRLPFSPAPRSAAGLPEGVRVQPLAGGRPGRLEIDFGTREDLWWKIAQFARARARNSRAIDELLEPGEP